jgi:hypothetical protein
MIDWCYKKSYANSLGQGANIPFPDDGVRVFLSHKKDKRTNNTITSLTFRFGNKAYKLFSESDYIVHAISYCARRIYFKSATKETGYKLYNQPRMKDCKEYKRDISQIEEYNVYPYCGIYKIKPTNVLGVYYISFDDRIRP